MKILFGPNTLMVEREDTDQHMKNESHFLYNLKKKLNEEGVGSGDWIKKLMWKDGHMVSEHQHYLRERNAHKVEGGGVWAIYSGDFALHDANVPFNKDGKVVLLVDRVEED